MRDPIEDEWALQMMHATPPDHVPELADVAGSWFPWEKADPRVREEFRRRARIYRAGDTSILPPTRSIGPPNMA